MEILLIFMEGLRGSLLQVWHLALIVVPLMVGMQILDDLRILEKVSIQLEKVVRFLGISGAGAFPLVIGLVLGLAYGAGMIIHYARQGQLSRRELLLIVTFLSINHSVFEDTLLFVAIGANGLLILLIRFAAAIIVTVLLNKLLPPDESNPLPAND
ncbi:MAG: nucleoside recognition domain-containing protein [Pseudomonadota bacterium]|nr:nucleoside recognition domain-containing protein [Pseudomonadota bacterium]